MLVESSRKYIDSIESLRSIAALSVLIYHLIALIMIYAFLRANSMGRFIQADELCGLGKLLLSAMTRRAAHDHVIDDEIWFELQLRPQYASSFGLNIPSLPSKYIQKRFTGKYGRENLREAFEFYKHVHSKFSDFSQIKSRYLNGEFQFFPSGGGGELTKDFYGEAIIPISYIEKYYGVALYNYAPRVDFLDQEVVVLAKGTTAVA